MADRPTLPQPAGARPDQLFPTLTAQMARIAAHGATRAVRGGDRLVEAGDQVVPFFVVVQGAIEIVQILDEAETIVAVHGPGQFSGEVNMISGRRALFTARAREDGTIIVLDREQVVKLVQNDPELSEILMRAFILRRVELVATGMGDVVLIGSAHSPGTLRVKEFLTRNSHPYTYIDLDREHDVQALLDRFHVAVSDVPVLICRGSAVLRNPTNAEIADCLGFNDGDRSDARARPGDRRRRAGGAGGGGLRRVRGARRAGGREPNAPGGQAGSSSRIENYLGFPTGISGQELRAAPTRRRRSSARRS